MLNTNETRSLDGLFDLRTWTCLGEIWLTGYRRLVVINLPVSRSTASLRYLGLEEMDGSGPRGNFGLQVDAHWISREFFSPQTQNTHNKNSMYTVILPYTQHKVPSNKHCQPTLSTKISYTYSAAHVVSNME